MSRSFRDLIVWQRAKVLAKDVYSVTESMPKSELYGLTSQIRRAAISVISNIAEGQGRLTKGEFQHFLGQARGSLLELETQLELSVDLGYITPKDFRKLVPELSEVGRLLNGLIASLQVTRTAVAS
jgi:four helix bundle protein